MGSIIYADITFIINFIMDFCILWATAKLAGVRVIYTRLIIVAGLGGIYAVGFLFEGMQHWYSLPVKILFSCLMIVFALWPRSWREFQKTFLYFYGINFTVAGATIAFSYLIQTSNYTISLPYFWLLGGIFCALAMGIYGEKYLTQRLIPELLNFDVQLKFEQGSCQGTGFLDTGNGLKDPLTNKPVLIAEYRLLKNCLPEDFQAAVEKNTDEAEIFDSLTQSSWAKRLRLIPFSSLGKQSGMLIGIRADEVIVNTGNNNIFHQNLVVGIYKNRLSNEGKYQLLIPSEILEKA